MLFDAVQTGRYLSPAIKLFTIINVMTKGGLLNWIPTSPSTIRHGYAQRSSSKFPYTE